MILLASVLLMASAGAGMFLMMAPAEVEESPEVVVVTPPEPAPARAPAPAPSEPAPSPVAAEPGAPLELPEAALNDDSPPRSPKRAEIWKALNEKHGLSPRDDDDPAPSEAAASLLPTLDKNYIRTAITEQLVPVAQECYESALEQDPQLGGKLVLSFTIVGAEDVGGVVESAEVLAEDSTMANAFVNECMRESVMAVEFAPPEGGGQVEVKYPFIFEAEDEP